jgi:hypothetical protein
VTMIADVLVSCGMHAEKEDFGPRSRALWRSKHRLADRPFAADSHWNEMIPNAASQYCPFQNGAALELENETLTEESIRVFGSGRA